jgi:hypothetical protein
MASDPGESANPNEPPAPPRFPGEEMASTGTAGLRPSLSKALNDSLKEDLERLRDRIAVRALEISGPNKISTAAIGRAFDELTGSSRREMTRWEFFWTIFPPFTLVCVIMCGVFAYLGFNSTGEASGPRGAGSAAGFLDIAKIFAGAIVGSTSSAAIGAIKNKRK